MNDVCDWTLKFIHRENMFVFPLRSNVGEQKLPVIRDWDKYSSMNMTMIEQWFRKNPDRGVGLPCGKNGLVVVDCDKAKANGIKTNGIDDFRKLCEEHDDKPSPVWQRTPSGGMHYFYKMGVQKIGNKTKVRRNGQKLNIDIKGERSYVAICAAPLLYAEDSVILDLADYPNNNVYTRHIEGVKKIPLLGAAPLFPEWLSRLLVTDDEWAGITPENTDIDFAIERCAQMIIGSHDGSRNNNLNNIVFSFMRYFRANPDAIDAASRAFIDAAVSCGISKKEVVKTIDSARKAALEVPPDAIVDMPRLIRDALTFKKSPKDPKNFDRSEKELGILPDPPLQALSLTLRDVVLNISEGKGVPLNMVFGMLIALGSACIGRARGVIYDETSDWKEFANLYIMSIAETGSGKTHTLNYIFKYLYEMEVQCKAKWKKDYDQYQRDMMIWKKNKKGDLPQIPNNTKYLIDDFTKSVFLKNLNDNPRGLYCLADELMEWIGNSDKYSMRHILLSAWDSLKIPYTSSNRMYAMHRSIGILWNVHPALLGKLFDKKDIEQGLPERFLYIRSKTTKPQHFPLPKIKECVRETLKRVTTRLLGLTMPINEIGLCEPEYIRFSNDAAILLESYMNYVIDDENKTDSREIAVKMNRMVMRIALILHYMEWAADAEEKPCESEIRATTVESAIKIISWFAAHAAGVRSLVNPV